MNKNIVWIASYPKSGNTWIRSLLSSLFYSEGGSFDFPMLKKITNFDKPFFYKPVIDEKYLQIGDLKNISKYRILAQKDYNKKNKIAFFKTHSANIKIDGHSYTSPETARGVIYIIRDPRDIVLSYSDFSNSCVSESINIIKNKKYSVANKKNQYTSLWSRWDYHVGSWLGLGVPKIFIRYEDMIDRPLQTALKLIMFLQDKLKINDIFSDDKILSSVRNTSFKKLKSKESKAGFDEALYGSNFFNSGKKNRWKNELKPKQIKEIEKEFSVTMKKFGYLS